MPLSCANSLPRVANSVPRIELRSSARPSRAAIVSFAIALGCATGFASSIARAGFTSEERERLGRGELVVEELSLDRGNGRFAGGLAYEIVDASWERLSAITRDVARFPELLPYVSSSKLLGIDASGVARVRVEHTVGPFHGAYTIKIAFSEGGRRARFWLDHDAENDLEEAWGFVRFTPIADGASTLVTYALLFDLGPGFLSLFESKIRAFALTYPRKLADAALR